MSQPKLALNEYFRENLSVTYRMVAARTAAAAADLIAVHPGTVFAENQVPGCMRSSQELGVKLWEISNRQFLNVY